MTTTKLICETATQADDLPQCCGAFPMDVTKPNGKRYVECPRCKAHTIPSHVEGAARRQWLAMHAAIPEPQPAPRTRGFLSMKWATGA